MIYGVYTVLDRAVGAFLTPFHARSKGEAIRSFTEAASDPQRFARHPDDFVLYFLGGFDDNSGLYTCSEPERILSVRECGAGPDGQSAPNGRAVT